MESGRGQWRDGGGIGMEGWRTRGREGVKERKKKRKVGGDLRISRNGRRRSWGWKG